MTLKRRDTERSRQHWDFVEQVSRRVQAERPAWMKQAVAKDSATTDAGEQSEAPGVETIIKPNDSRRF